MDFGSIVRKSARMYGSNTAVVYGDRKLTYADLYERSCKLVNGLAANGVKPGDRVCTLEENSLESVEQLTGVALGGFVRSPMYTQNTPDVTAYMLNLVGARALIIQDNYWKDLVPYMSEAPSVETVIVRGDTSDGALNYDDVLAKASADDPMVRVDPDDVHIIRFSAGTTGRPKGIYHTMRNWLGMGNEIALML